MKRWLFVVLAVLFCPFQVLAEEPPLLEKWQALGLCQGEVSYQLDYYEFAGEKVYGELWQCASQNQNLTPEDFRKHLSSLGFEELTVSEYTVEARKALPDGYLWLRFQQTNPALVLVRQRVVHPGESLTITLPKDGEKFYFYLEYPRDRYLSFLVEIPEETEIYLESSGEFRHGKLKEKFNYSRQCSSTEGRRHLLYDLPPVAGLQLWAVRDYGNSAPYQITIRVLEEGHLVPLPQGGRLGGILLKNVPYGRAKAQPEGDVYFSHPDFTEENYTGDLTPQGNAVFWLPPGYWRLMVDPLQGEKLAQLEARLIPVFPGYLTEVEWPASVSRLFEEDGSVRLEIIGHGTEGTHGHVDFALLNLSRESALEPRVKDLTVLEAGIAGKVTKVERLKTPPEVVVLLDSSGSMKYSMKAALKATANFIQGLPKESRVTLIDFDTRPKCLASGPPAKVLPALSKVRANGATALYDAVLMGLAQLKQANRPTLILFTDGKDANYNDTGPGSKASAKEVFEAAREAGVPIFTIGFGKSPDVATLSRLAALTGGEYYPAEDHQALKKVFARIRQNFGHQWRVYYERPQKAGPGEKPVLALVVDNSGSMEKRLERVRQVLHDFVKGLPEGFLLQLFTFSTEVYVKQVLTDDKLAVLRGLSEMKPLSGTNILASVEEAYRFLHAVPSTRRYLLYLTDEALKVDDRDQEKFEILLQKLKDDGVKSLWVGMVDQDEGGVFAQAAKLSGGRFVIAPQPEALAEALSALGKDLAGPVEGEGHLLRVVFKHTDRFGRTSLYSAAVISKAPLPESQEETKNPEALVWRKGEALKPYGGELARLVTGEDAVGREVRVLKRIPLHVSAENKAVRLTLKEAIFLSRLRGIDAPSGRRFLALTMTLENILPPQEVVVYPNGSAHPAAWVSGAGQQNARVVKKIPDYLIPDARLHFFLSWNNETSFPVSEATYLAETPLILPGENEIYVRPGHPVTGTIIFLVPDEFMAQSALHLYDVAYGHLDLPISGVLKVKREEITKLPTKAPAKLSDTFSLTLEGFRDAEKLYEVSAEEGNVFRVIEATLTSKIQAHLAIRPAERFYLALETPQGDFLFRLHPVTARVPLGFYEPRLVTPGSFNRLRLVFEIPKALAKAPAKLLIDVKGGPVAVPLGKGLKKDFSAALASAKGKGAELFINGVYWLEEDKRLVLDLTVRDLRDDHATAVANFLGLSFTEEAKARLKEKYLSLRQDQTGGKGLSNFAFNLNGPQVGDLYPTLFGEYLTAFDYETLILNGETRRGFVFFDLPEETTPKDFVLVSSVFKDLNLPLPNPKPFPYQDWLTRATPYEREDTFEQEVQRVLARLTKARQARGFVKPGSMCTAATTLEGTPPAGIPVPPPSLLVSGGKRWEEIKDLKTLKEALKGVRLIPSNWRAWQVAYAPEAVFTQNWGTENEWARLAEVVLSRQGLETRRLVVALTDQGKEAVKKFYGALPTDLYELPALAYDDEQGKHHLLIFPFFREARELSGLIKSQDEADVSPPKVSLEVIVEAKPLGGAQSQVAAEITGALAGEEEESLERIVLLSESIPLAQASLDALDLGFVEAVDREKGRVIKAVLDTPEGRRVGEESLPLAKYFPVRMRLKFYTPEETYETVRELRGRARLTDFFFVMGVNVPDLPEASLVPVDTAWKKVHEEAKNPDVISSLRWLGRGIIARFVGAQTAYERKMAQKLGLTLVRLKDPRILVVTFRRPKAGDRPLVSLDLVNAYPKVWTSEEKAAYAFNIMAGLYYTALEGGVVPKGIDTFTLWRLLPKGTPILFIGADEVDEFAEILKHQGYPAWLTEHLADCGRCLLFPSRPLVVKGRARTAWLEIDPHTYRLYSYLDTGERGVTETIFTEDVAVIADYLVGFWLGVETSVWSTAAFSLVLTDWKEIKTQAHAFARQLAGYLTAVTNPKDTLGPEAEKAAQALSGDLLGALGLEGFRYGGFSAEELQKQIEEDTAQRGWGAEDVKDLLEEKDLEDLKEKIKEKYLGFTNGFKDGVDWYFR